jgi:hypothetical protein
VLTCRQPPDPQPAACAYLQPALPRTAELLIVIRFRILSRFYDLSPYVPKSVCSRYEKAIDRLYFDGAAVLGNPDGQVAPVRLRGNLRNPLVASAKIVYVVPTGIFRKIESLQQPPYPQRARLQSLEVSPAHSVAQTPLAQQHKESPLIGKGGGGKSRSSAISGQRGLA